MVNKSGARRVCGLGFEVQNHFDLMGLLGGLEGFFPIGQFETTGNQAIDHDLLGGQGIKGVGKGAAAGTDEGDFVHDEGGEVDRLRLGQGAFENDFAAGTDEGAGGREARG